MNETGRVSSGQPYESHHSQISEVKGFQVHASTLQYSAGPTSQRFDSIRVYIMKHLSHAEHSSLEIAKYLPASSLAASGSPCPA